MAKRRSERWKKSCLSRKFKGAHRSVRVASSIPLTATCHASGFGYCEPAWIWNGESARIRTPCMSAVGDFTKPGNEWWARSDLNRGPSDYESPALTAELRAQAAVMVRGKRAAASQFAPPILLPEPGGCVI